MDEYQVICCKTDNYLSMIQWSWDQVNMVHVNGIECTYSE